MASDRSLLEHVLVATDFSPGAAAALSRAARLPVSPTATLSLLHVIPESIPGDLRDAVAERSMATLRDAAAEMAPATPDRPSTVKVECSVVVGTPHVEIVRHARVGGAELVVIGRHGARPVRDAFLGTTAERVIRKGDVPVLLVNEPATAAYQRPLVAIDLSDVSRRVADLALSLLPDGARSLRMVHAFHVGFEGWLSVPALEAYRREQQALATASAEALAAEYSDRGVHCEVTVCHGDPRIVVLREAVRERSDLVVVGTHARSGVAHALLGSVAEWLVRASPCDVAVTRPARFTFELP